jgi:hypothetical protein
MKERESEARHCASTLAFQCLLIKVAAEMCVYRTDDAVAIARVYLQMAHSGACCISVPLSNVKHTKAGDKPG